MVSDCRFHDHPVAALTLYGGRCVLEHCELVRSPPAPAAALGKGEALAAVFSAGLGQGSGQGSGHGLGRGFGETPLSSLLRCLPVRFEPAPFLAPCLAPAAAKRKEAHAPAHAAAHAPTHAPAAHAPAAHSPTLLFGLEATSQPEGSGAEPKRLPGPSPDILPGFYANLPSATAAPGGVSTAAAPNALSDVHWDAADAHCAAMAVEEATGTVLEGEVLRSRAGDREAEQGSEGQGGRGTAATAAAATATTGEGAGVNIGEGALQLEGSAVAAVRRALAPLLTARQNTTDCGAAARALPGFELVANLDAAAARGAAVLGQGGLGRAL